MGHGDDIMATGMAKGAKARGKRIAFGDGNRIIWGPFSRDIFRNNPNIAHPGQERDKDIEWVKYYKGNRGYNKSGGNHWVWNYDFKTKPGEIFFGQDDVGYCLGSNVIFIEPNVPNKPCAPNKQWPLARWKEVAEELELAGFNIVQPEYGGPNRIAEGIRTNNFRDGMALLKQAKLAILPEGGLHHAAAALGVPAVVLFGGFVPPSVLGYHNHINLTGGAVACGSFTRCQHCLEAMDKITVDDVLKGVEACQ